MKARRFIALWRKRPRVHKIGPTSTTPPAVIAAPTAAPAPAAAATAGNAAPTAAPTPAVAVASTTVTTAGVATAGAATAAATASANVGAATAATAATAGANVGATAAATAGANVGATAAATAGANVGATAAATAGANVGAATAGANVGAATAGATVGVLIASLFPSVSPSKSSSLSPSLSLSGAREVSEGDPGSSLINSAISVKMEFGDSASPNYKNQIDKSQSLVKGGNGNQYSIEREDCSSMSVDIQISENENRENTAIDFPSRTNLNQSGIRLSGTEGETETMEREREKESSSDGSAEGLIKTGQAVETEIEGSLEIKREIAIDKMDLVKDEMTIQVPVKIEKTLDLTIPDPRPAPPRPPIGPQDASMKRAETKRKAQSMITDAHHRFLRERSNMRRGLGPDGREMDISSLSRVASMAAVYLHLTGKRHSTHTRCF
jgi:hypothetical protein